MSDGERTGSAADILGVPVSLDRLNAFLVDAVCTLPQQDADEDIKERAVRILWHAGDDVCDAFDDAVGATIVPREVLKGVLNAMRPALSTVEIPDEPDDDHEGFEELDPEVFDFSQLDPDDLTVPEAPDAEDIAEVDRRLDQAYVLAARVLGNVIRGSGER